MVCDAAEEAVVYGEAKQAVVYVRDRLAAGYSRPVSVGDATPVGVIGGGGSGILAARALKRAGLPFEILEARDGLGGTWRYDPDGDGSACYESLVANTSKLRMSVGSRRIPGRPWEYATHTEMLAYLGRLAADEGLLPHLRPNWRVAEARPVDGGWALVSSEGERRSYSALVCALGVSGRPRMAELPGDFEGEQLHSAEHRTPERFAGRRVLVIGAGTSGSEICGDVAGSAASVVLSVRTPVWTMPRRVGGVPLDWLNPHIVARTVPWSLRRRVLAGTSMMTSRGMRRRGLPPPARRCGDEIIAISDTVRVAMERGLVDVRPEIVAVEGRRVSFADGTSTEPDVIVHATGFGLPTGFLAEEDRPDSGDLFRAIAHPDRPGLHFVGLIEAHRALLPIADEQAEWSADVLAGRVLLPAGEELREAVSAEVRRRRRDFSERGRFMVDFGPYLETLRRDRRAGRAVAV